MALYKPAFGIGQLNPNAWRGGSFDCMPWSDSKVVDRVTHGRQKPSAPRIRAQANDYSGGLNMTQVQAVDTKYYGFTPAKFMPILWTDLMGLAQERSYLLCVGYGPISNTKYDCFGGRFRDNHALYVQSRLFSGLDEADPGADGRRAGIPHGYQTLPFSLARQAAGALDLSGLGTSAYRPLGAGKAYVLLAPKDPPPVVDPVAYTHKVKVLVNGLAVRARPRTSAAKVAHRDKGAIIQCTKLMRHGGSYRGPAGHIRTDWLGFTRLGRTVWVARAFTKVV